MVTTLNIGTMCLQRIISAATALRFAPTRADGLKTVCPLRRYSALLGSGDHAADCFFESYLTRYLFLAHAQTSLKKTRGKAVLPASPLLAAALVGARL